MSATDQNSSTHAKTPEGKMPDPTTQAAKMCSAQMPTSPQVKHSCDWIFAINLIASSG